ncbi:MAG: hypothetical protein JNK82_18770 [Myxococcaceae bacterium]|nr:hypothetical protein [Myxococcaceae bacterium]
MIQVNYASALIPDAASMSPAHRADASGRHRELAQRWARARVAALRAAIPATDDASEEHLLVPALETDLDGTLRRVFDNSARLGFGYRRTWSEEHGVATLPALLDSLEAPCLRGGAWRLDRGAAALERRPCRTRSSPQVCDYWREAIDGLVAGLSGASRHTRHRSLGHGDDVCLDLLYDDPESPLRFGPLPAEVSEAARGVLRLVAAFSSAAELTLLGVSEGVLAYRLSPPDGNLRALVERELRQKLPTLRFRELSPRPVYGGP